MSAVVETKKLTKYYGKARGILDVDLEIQEGEVFGFIGPNGAGKSTTIRTLLGLIHRHSGEARIFSLDCERDKVKILADVGYLPARCFTTTTCAPSICCATRRALQKGLHGENGRTGGHPGARSG
jgi:ABC-2 type transport system ATP-binding protein